MQYLWSTRSEASYRKNTRSLLVHWTRGGLFLCPFFMVYRIRLILQGIRAVRSFVIYQKLDMERLFTRNETENNEIVSKLFIGIFIFVLLVWTLCWCGVFDFDIQVASIFLCISAIFLLTPYVFIYVFHLNSKGMKYILILNLSHCHLPHQQLQHLSWPGFPLRFHGKYQ